MPSRKENREHGNSVALAPKKSRVKPPPLYRVFLLNDDFTPMDFVIVVLENFFAMNREMATLVMLKVHHEGKGLCGEYPHDVAATKVERVTTFARQHQHPLACVMEEVR
ncbi:ATP-dependent Clp protease adapter ClpS [Denitratisoma oestradiolicum]|uniref:ATP-dependent Clp protease adapter protein ClpS n=1 Tax=Denitratisoma oestradiolicum TaxID=311182 RepID=A0A6S6XSS6_9PROT|nr:ATP-dependent Clp protease adapter ClpS [Denitratisoma oestradiolicum]TWO81092.1 ATP-dependent Clp protease adapter ClpS [Denitratisoma oestradiolicum]CAB1367770.1 regulatory protein for ClpA substrate specificity [Denitratisoma oestradiolicum]